MEFAQRNMFKGTVIKRVFLTVALLGACSLAWSANIISSFEGGSFAGWTTQGDGWSVYGRAASDGKKSAMCSVSKGEAGMKACVRMIDQAEPGWIIKANLDIAGKTKTKSSKAKVVIMCIDAKGNTLRESAKELTVAPAKFQSVSIPEIVIPSGTAATYMMLVVEIPEPARGNEYWRFDDVIINIQ
jgi:hypothetical protein